jgi:hypothetical protein
VQQLQQQDTAPCVGHQQQNKVSSGNMCSSGNVCSINSKGKQQGAAT